MRPAPDLQTSPANVRLLFMDNRYVSSSDRADQPMISATALRFARPKYLTRLRPVAVRFVSCMATVSRSGSSTEATGILFRVLHAILPPEHPIADVSDGAPNSPRFTAASFTGEVNWNND